MALAASLVPLGLSTSVHAGDGSISQASLTDPVEVELHVHVGFPLSGPQVSDLKLVVEDAADILCDTTEGAVQIKKVYLDSAGYGAISADVLIVPPGIQSANFGTLSASKPFGSPTNLVRMRMDAEGHQWAHELGHSVLGLADSYDSQRRNGRAHGYGPAFDYDINDPNWPRNHSVMQWTRDGSELSTLANHDPLRGDGSGYPGIRPGDTFKMRGHFQDQAAGGAVVFDPTDFGTAKASLLDVYELIDATGDLSKGKNKRSSHYVYVYIDKTAAFEWTLYFGIDDGQLANGTAGDLTIFDSIDLTFDDTAGVGGTPNGTAYPLELVDGLPLGNASVTIDVPALAAAPAMQLDLDLGSGGIDDIDDLFIADDPVPAGDEYIELTDLRDLTFNAGGLHQLGATAKLWADDSWSTLADRFESSSQTNYVLEPVKGLQSLSVYDNLNTSDFPTSPDDWSLFQFNMLNRQSESLDITYFLPQGEPQELGSSSGCPVAANDPDFWEPLIAGVERVYLVIDKTDSMIADQESVGNWNTRLGWAKEAARTFVKLAEPSNMEIGLIVFNQGSETLLEARSIVSVPSVPAATEWTLSEFDDAIYGIETDGETNIAQAIIAGKDALDAHSDVVNSTALMLISDGEQNFGGMAPEEAADILRAATPSIPVFVTPVGDFDATGLGDIAEITRGEMFPSDIRQVTPLAYTQMFARFRGESMALEPTLSTLNYGEAVTHTIPVEVGAGRLNIVVSNGRNDLLWTGTDVTINGPNGENYVLTDGSIDPIFDMSPEGHTLRVSVQNPSTGDWTLTITSNLSGAPVSHHSVAHIENPEPGCRVGLSRRSVSSESETIAVSAIATWGGITVEEGATYNVTIEGPDGILLSLPMESSDEEEGVVGYFNQYTGAGQYKVSAQCDVVEGAELSVGEQFEGEPDLTPDLAPKFSRVDQKSFRAKFTTWKLPPGGDCDDDGFSDAIEGALGTEVLHTADPAFDADGDGRPDACDPDSDGDELPDAQEGTGDTDGDTIADRVDRDSDNDGDLDGVDANPVDANYFRYASGDIDGDGRTDTVRGEPDGDGGRGQIVVRYGSDGATETWNRNSPGIADVSNIGDEFGASVAVGDFDGDGFDDVAIGSPGDDLGSKANAGSIHVIYGSASGLSTSGDQVWHQDTSGIQGVAEAGDRFGDRLAIGDFDGNNYDDVAVGTPWEAIGSKTYAGAVNVLYSSSGGITSTDDVWYQSVSGVNGTSEAMDGFGAALAVGNFNDGNEDDLVIGVPDEDYGGTVDAGYVYVMYGSVSFGLSTTGDFGFFQSYGGWADSSQTNDTLGSRFWIEDRDGDGYDDLTAFVPLDGCGTGTKGFHVAYGGNSGLSSNGNALECLEAYQDHQ